MSQKIKPILTVFLLTFAGITLAVQIAKEFRIVEPMRLTESGHHGEALFVIYAHATVRCPTCTTMERLTKETLDESFKDAVSSKQIAFLEINYERPELAAFVEHSKIATVTIVLKYVRNKAVINQKNLADAAWKLYTDEPAFKAMLKEQIDAMLQGERQERVERQ